MADVNPPNYESKGAPVESTLPAEPASEHIGHDLPAAVFNEQGELILPSGWIYRRLHLGRWASPWYASPKVQLVFVAMVCFLCPGMFNALSGLGGGGKTDATLADDMVITLPS